MACEEAGTESRRDRVLAKEEGQEGEEGGRISKQQQSYGLRRSPCAHSCGVVHLPSPASSAVDLSLRHALKPANH